MDQQALDGLWREGLGSGGQASQGPEPHELPVSTLWPPHWLFPLLPTLPPDGTVIYAAQSNILLIFAQLLSTLAQ